MSRDSLWGGRSRVLFGQMYEDAAIEQAVFRPDSRVFAIASAGCTAIALSQHHRVTAVDINPAQLEYARHRGGGGSRCLGAAEQAMETGRQAMRLAGWSKPKLDEFSGLADCQTQLAFWRKHLNTRRFRWIFDAAIASAVFLVGKRSPDIASVPGRGFGPVLRARIERGLRRFPNRDNPFAERMFSGRPRHESGKKVGLPPHFVAADAAAYLESCPAESFDAFTLSNIADGVTPQYAQRLFAAVRHAASPDAVAVLRSFRETADEKQAELAAQDRAMFWGSLYCGPAGRLS